MAQREPRIFYLLQQAYSALFRASDRALREQHGIGTAQQAILFALNRSDGTPISELAAQLSMRKSSLSGLVDRMEAAQLVRREQSGQDARSLLVFLEAKGRDCARQSLPSTKRINALILEPFNDSERVVITRFLEHIAKNSDALVVVSAEPEAPPQNSEKRKSI